MPKTKVRKGGFILFNTERQGILKVVPYCTLREAKIAFNSIVRKKHIDFESVSGKKHKVYPEYLYLVKYLRFVDLHAGESDK